MKLVKLANFEPVKKPMKYGTWPIFFMLMVYWLSLEAENNDAKSDHRDAEPFP